MSWKKYGGTNHLESFNNITTSNITTDYLTVKFPSSILFTFSGDLTFTGNTTYLKDAIFENNLFMEKDIDVLRDAIIHGNTFQYKPLYFVGSSGQGLNRYDSSGMYLLGDISGITVNKTNPEATFDINGTRVESLNVYTNQSSNRSILSRNQNHSGIILYTDNSASNIEFYHQDISINSSNYSQHGGGRICYEPSGIIILDTSTNINLLSTTSISNRKDLLTDHVNDETVIIYDISTGVFLSSIYDNSSCYTGVSLSLISSDLSSNTFLKITNTDGSKGWGWNAGAYPGDMTRNMTTTGWMDVCKNYIPTQTIVSGNSSINTRSTIGINTYSPETEKYIIDINGPLHLHHNEVHLVGEIPFEILSVSFSKRPMQTNYGIAVGSFYDVSRNFYSIYTTDGGKTWNLGSRIIAQPPTSDLGNYNSVEMNVSMYDMSFSFLTAKQGIRKYSKDYGRVWEIIPTEITIPSIDNPDDPLINFVTQIYNLPLKLRTFLCYTTEPKILSIDFSLDDYGDLTDTIGDQVGILPYTISLTNIMSCHGSNSYFFIAGDGIESFDISSGGFVPLGSGVYSISNTYRKIKTLDGLFTVAAGDGIISYTYNSGINWLNYNQPLIQDISFNDICMYDSSNVIIVGNDSQNNGKIIFSTDSAVSWNLLTPEMVSSMAGNSTDIFRYKITSISIQPDFSNAFIITSSVIPYTLDTIGKSNIYCVYFSYLFNPQSRPAILDVCGNMVLSGDMNINEEGRLCTTNSTFYLLDQNANNIYFGHDASNIHIGQHIEGGTTYIRHQLDVFDNVFLHKTVYTNNIQCFQSDISFYIGTDTTNNIDKKNIIIGSTGDTIILNGSVKSVTVNTLNISDKKIILNAENNTYNSSGSGGLFIRDDNNDSAGYIKVSNDRTAYIIKAPGSTNILNFDVSSMVFDTNATLSMDDDRRKYQNVVMKLKKSDYLDSSFSMLASSLDISNIFIKDIARSTDLTNNTQKVSTNVGISGNLFINKDFSGFPDTALDVNGNVIMSKLGIGTSEVKSDYYLEVSGNMTQTNGWIHQF
jgi:hypothetical protein